jgi:hypothetical protein
MKIQLTSLALRAWIRTFVSAVVGGGITYIVQHFVFKLNPTWIIPATVGVTAFYNALIQKIEKKFKWAAFFLGALPAPKESVPPAPTPVP